MHVVIATTLMAFLGIAAAQEEPIMTYEPEIPVYDEPVMPFPAEPAPSFNTWFCVADIATPLRRFKSDDIECASFNGRDCLWQPNMDACYALTDKLNAQVNSSVRPLRCGNDHQFQYGITGYAHPAHWCARSYNMLQQYTAKTAWTCLGGINTPVRVNHWGEVECMSTNRRDCLWRGSNADCNAVMANPPDPIIPMDCRADHWLEHGMVGYDGSNHWCRTSARAFGLMN